MKHVLFLLILLNSTFMDAQTLPDIDVRQYEGDWYVIGYKPSKIDKGWIDTKEHYDWNAAKKRFDVVATYKTELGGKEKSTKEKLLPVENSSNARWMAHIWLFIRADYVIYKIADDYSYVVVGHPKHKYVYIMARKPKMEEELYQLLVDFCVTLGYQKEEIVKHVQTAAL